ncbi:MAG: type II secretion system protein N [Pseudomonadales bacterium]
MLAIAKLKPALVPLISLMAVCLGLWACLLISMKLLAPPHFEPSNIQAANAGQIQASWFKPKAAISNAPKATGKSRLRAELLGVMANGDRGVATLSLNGGKPAVYVLGAEVQSGITLQQIHGDRVVFDENGVSRELLMAKIDAKGIARVDEPLQDTSDQQLISLAGKIGVQPQRTESGAMGMKLQSLDQELMDLSSLQPGDVVLSAGGESIEALLSSPEKWQALINESSVPLVIIRDGKEQQIDVNAAAMAARMLPHLMNSFNGQ